MLTDPGYSLKLRTPPVQIADFYSSMSDINKASLVALYEGGIIADELAARIGCAVRDLIERENQPGAPRIAYADASGIYQEHAGAPLPISEVEFAQAIDPVHISATRKGRGGPQRDEVERMLDSSGQQLHAHRQWLASKQKAAAEAKQMLEGAFARLLSPY